jgi:RNA-directed DNA polymerase
VRSQAAGERVMASVVAFLEGKLRLKVNRAKSAVAAVMERSFLGYRLLPGGRLGLPPKSLDRVKETLRRITRRNRGISLERMVGELNGFTTGWVTYFLHAACKSTHGYRRPASSRTSLRAPQAMQTCQATLRHGRRSTA